MKKLLLGSLAAGAVLAAAHRLFATTVSAEPVSGGGPYGVIHAYIEGQMRRLNIPGLALAIVEGDRIVHLAGFGHGRPGGEAPTPQTPFVLGSTTKSFTALAVMQLVEAGKVELDAPVQRYLPWFRVADPQASAEMTVRHLLNQTSGLPMLSGMSPLADLDDSPGAAERQAQALSTLRLTRPVGAAFEYSNLNYNLLGLIVEAAGGESYADAIQHHIFAPLGMSHSYTSQAAAKRDGLAVGHRYWFAHPVAMPDLPLPHGSLASGQLISTSEDMAHYLIAQLNGGRFRGAQILSSAGIDELHRGVAEVRVMNHVVEKYGMGWFVSEIGSYETRFARRQRSRLLLLYGPPAGAEERGGPAAQRRPLWIALHPAGGWVGRGRAARRPAAPSDPTWLHPLGDARTAADPARPNRRCRRHAAAVTPLAPGPGAPPERWMPVGAPYPAAADPEPVVSGAPGTSEAPGHAPLPAAL